MMKSAKCSNCGAALQTLAGPEIRCAYCQHTQVRDHEYEQDYEHEHEPESEHEHIRIVVAPPPPPDSSPLPFLNVSTPQIVTAFMVAVVGIGVWGVSHFAGGGKIGFNRWDGKEPLTCNGNDVIEIQGVKASFSAGAAIVAESNCQITCRDCTIEAPVVARASGNARITIVNGSVKGTEASFIATSNAKVDVRGNAVVTGPVKKSSNAEVFGIAPPAPPISPSAGAARAAKK